MKTYQLAQLQLAYIKRTPFSTFFIFIFNIDLWIKKVRSIWVASKKIGVRGKSHRFNCTLGKIWFYLMSQFFNLPLLGAVLLFVKFIRPIVRITDVQEIITGPRKIYQVDEDEMSTKHVANHYKFVEQIKGTMKACLKLTSPYLMYSFWTPPRLAAMQAISRIETRHL